MITLKPSFVLERVDGRSGINPRDIIRFNVIGVSEERCWIQHKIVEDRMTGKWRCDCPGFVVRGNCPHMEHVEKVLG